MTLGAILGTVAIVVVTIALGVVVDRRFRLSPRPEALAEDRPRPPAHVAGEAPATAIRAGAAQLAKLRASQRCTACRALLVAGDDDHVRYDNRDLIVLQFRCPSCAAKRALYVEPTA